MNDPGDLLSVVDLALREDIGLGDWTTSWTVPEKQVVRAAIIAKAAGVVAGTEVATTTFQHLDPSVLITIMSGDSTFVRPGTEVLRLYGSARSILTAERVALNFLQHLSGVATQTRAFVDAVAGTGVKILDTRKTTPGLRRWEKEAVVAGGGFNHRVGLYDMVLIKENHLRAAGGIRPAVSAVAAMNQSGLEVEVEVTNLDETVEALNSGVHRILFDNMPISLLREAVRIVRASSPATQTEASGGVSLSSVREIAETGVDYISVGALTHSAPALDLSLLVEADA
jgi:nicotinate-nucleotide pyrophosphorylase (carboxylating)